MHHIAKSNDQVCRKERNSSVACYNDDAKLLQIVSQRIINSGSCVSLCIMTDLETQRDRGKQLKSLERGRGRKELHSSTDIWTFGPNPFFLLLFLFSFWQFFDKQTTSRPRTCDGTDGTEGTEGTEAEQGLVSFGLQKILNKERLHRMGWQGLK